jgi:HD superfamily phosphohydrolase YqeK
MRSGRKVGRVDDETPQSRAEHCRGVAETLRGLAAQIPYDIRHRNQLLALAAGFERFADRFQLEAADEELSLDRR